MSLQRRPLTKKGKKKQVPKLTPKNKMLALIQSSRGLYNRRPRERFLVVANFKFVLNNATLINPFCYAYFNLSNPLKSNGGAPTSVSYWSQLIVDWRKFLIFEIYSDVWIESQETFGTIAGMGPVNFLPPNTVAQSLISFAMPQTEVTMMSGVGSPNKTHLTRYVSLNDYGGFDPKNSEDAHWGGISPAADPVDNMYMSLLVDTNGVASVSGLLVNVRLYFHGIAAEINQSF